jgi:N-acetylneuraminic acid mutarotase
MWKFNPQTGLWTWMGGSNTTNAGGVYGTKGVGSTANTPGAREFMTTWVGQDGLLWLFGGYGFDGAGHLGYLNDLWKYDPDTGVWTWVDGPNAVDTGGVYGTKGTEAAGNLPGARYGAVAWNVRDGYIWLFGGYGVDTSGSVLGYLNDLWRYNPANGQWTWMSGSSNYGQLGTYGTKGVAAAGNTPGQRGSTIAVGTWWSGDLYLFGGLYADSGGTVYLYNDLWKYNTTSHLWTWVSGSNVTNVTGVYGTRGTPAAANAPGSRGGMVGWQDEDVGSILIFGGMGYDSTGMTTDTNPNLNDLWSFNLGTGEWTWVDGSNAARDKGFYWTLGTTSPLVHPSARDSATVWRGSFGHVWLFGGAGYDSNGTYDSYGLNDLWEYIP